MMAIGGCGGRAMVMRKMLAGCYGYDYGCCRGCLRLYNIINTIFSHFHNFYVYVNYANRIFIAYVCAGGETCAGYSRPIASANIKVSVIWGGYLCIIARKVRWMVDWIDTIIRQQQYLHPCARPPVSESDVGFSTFPYPRDKIESFLFLGISPHVIVIYFTFQYLLIITYNS